MTATEIRHPEVSVKLVGEDGNAFAIIGAATKALRKANVATDEVAAFQHECFSAASYDHLLRTVMSWMDVS